LAVSCPAPEDDSLQAVALPYHTQTSAYGRLLELSLPKLRYFSTIWIEWE